MWVYEEDEQGKEGEGMRIRDKIILRNNKVVTKSS